MRAAAPLLAVLVLLAGTAVAVADPTGEQPAPTYRDPVMLRNGYSEGRRKPPCEDMTLTAAVRIAACRTLTDGGVATIDTWHALGLAYADHGDDAAAIDAFTHAIDPGGYHYLSLVERALAYARSGDFDRAMADAERFTTSMKGVPQALAMRCRIRAIADQDRDAGLADCDRALAREPRLTSALIDRALLLYRLGRLPDALAASNTAVASGGQGQLALYLRGTIEKQTGALAAGDADMTAALARDPAVAEQLTRYRPARPDRHASDEAPPR